MLPTKSLSLLLPRLLNLPMSTVGFERNGFLLRVDLRFQLPFPGSKWKREGEKPGNKVSGRPDLLTAAFLLWFPLEELDIVCLRVIPRLLTRLCHGFFQTCPERSKSWDKHIRWNHTAPEHAHPT